MASLVLQIQIALQIPAQAGIVFPVLYTKTKDVTGTYAETITTVLTTIALMGSVASVAILN